MKETERIFILLLALMLTVEVIVSCELLKQSDEENIELQSEIAGLKEQIANCEKEIDNLTKEIKAQQAKQSEAQNTSRGGERLVSLGEYTITAYCACAKCCGKWATNRPGGKVIGAAGVELTPGVSVAAWLPFGTRLLIDGQEYVVEDRTAGWIRDKYDGRIIDIYFADHAQALEWGKRTAEVWAVSK